MTNGSRTVKRHLHVAGALLSIVLGGCGVSPAGSVESLTPSVAASVTPSASLRPPLPSTPSDQDYHPSQGAVVAAAMGQVITSVEIRSVAGTRAWFVVYRSTGYDGQPIPVSGLIVAPKAPPPTAGGYPVVAWAHGTTGVADLCSPSKPGIGNLPPDLLALVAKGYVLTATDYEGLGTDGIHPYGVGASAARSVLNSIRAATSLPDAHAGPRSVVIGLSQGGHATLWAAQLAASYAPDLQVLGAFAASPPSDMAGLERWAFGQAAAGNIDVAAPLVMIFGVWHVVYGASLDFLTDGGRASALGVPNACDPTMPSTTPYASDPALLPEWHALLAENSPGAVRTSVPIRVVSPNADQAVAYDTQVAGVAALCAIGDTVEFITVSGGHDASINPPDAWAAAISWIGDRFAGVAPVRTCAS